MNNITVKRIFKLLMSICIYCIKTVDIKLTFLFYFRLTCQCELICQCEFRVRNGFSCSYDINNRDNGISKVE